MILRIFLDEFCKLRRERCGHRDRQYLAKIAKKILKSRVYKNISHKFNQFLILESITIVTGPSFNSSTFMSAPKMPRFTAFPVISSTCRQ